METVHHRMGEVGAFNPQDRIDEIIKYMNQTLGWLKLLVGGTRSV